MVLGVWGVVSYYDCTKHPAGASQNDSQKIKGEKFTLVETAEKRANGENSPADTNNDSAHELADFKFDGVHVSYSVVCQRKYPVFEAPGKAVSALSFREPGQRCGGWTRFFVLS